MKLFVAIIEGVNLRVGQAMGWMMLALVLLVTGDVISRYVFNTGAVIVQESEWWMFSIIFLMCAGYTFLYNEHVRVDIIYSRLSQKWQHVVDLGSAFVFLFPMCVLVIWTSKWYIEDSWHVGEYSADPGGMCCYYVLKGMIPLGFSLLFLQGIANVYNKIRALNGEEVSFTRPDGMAARAAMKVSEGQALEQSADAPLEGESSPADHPGVQAE